jgi:hypothetical protein
MAAVGMTVAMTLGVTVGTTIAPAGLLAVFAVTTSSSPWFAAAASEGSVALERPPQAASRAKTNRDGPSHALAFRILVTVSDLSEI